MMKFVLGLAAGVLLTVATPAFAQQTPGTPDLPATLQPETDDYHQYTASVIELTPLRRQGDGQNDLNVHIYGTAGGDPAMNGLNTYIAFYQSPADGHQVFQIGDFNSYRVVSERRGQVVLQISENTIDANANIGNRTRRITVSWNPPRDGTAPASIRVTAAR
jgi:hypothetical protein